MRTFSPSRKPFTFSLLLAITLQSGIATAETAMSPEEEALYKNMMQGAGIDPAQMNEAKAAADAVQRVTDSNHDLVDYHIVGVYQAPTNVVGDPNWRSLADVSDRVVIDLQWQLSESALAGSPSIENSKSTVSNPRNFEPSCQPPVLKGDYEHFDLLEIKQGLSGALELLVKTSYPEVEVVQSCTGSHKTIPASSSTQPMEMVVPSPVMLGMQLPDSDDLRISPDKKSLIRKQDGWTWTFTPSTSQ